MEKQDKLALEKIRRLAQETGINIQGGRVRRTSSRFCLGVEHGDYNGTELFGVGADRFIWLAYRPNSSRRIRLFSGNFPQDGIIEFDLGQTPPPRSPSLASTWGRFPCGVNYILRRQGYRLENGMDGIIYGNIPGGGMSRSASLTLNLMLSLLEVNNIEIKDKFEVADMAQAVENDYIGSPCGKLDQVMIIFAKKGLGAHYNPKKSTVEYIPLGGKADFRLISLDTGTERPGLEKSTYKIRRAECEEFVRMLKQKYNIQFLSDVKDQALYQKIMAKYQARHPNLCARLRYIFHAQQRFYQMLKAWRRGDLVKLGEIFRKDGQGLRDDYQISGAELETMCDIARTVAGVYGERMLGGGDKGAVGAIVQAKSVTALRRAVGLAYPRSHPEYSDRYAVHVCRIVDGIKTFVRASG